MPIEAISRGMKSFKTQMNESWNLEIACMDGGEYGLIFFLLGRKTDQSKD